MLPVTDPTAEEIAVLTDAVAEAGALVLTYFGHSPETWDKPGEGPVSEADLAANDLLQSRLMGAFPDHGWLSEESADDPARLSRSRVWIIDPIDGTRAFIDGKPEFTICAALAVEGEPVAGVVFNPVKNESFAAIRGCGTTLNGQRLIADRIPLFADANVLSRKSVLKPSKWQGDAPGGRHGYVNSIAYRVCKVATDRWDAAIALNELSEWDLAAADIVLREAGGVVTTRTGAPLRYNKQEPKVEGLVAAIPPLHGEIIARLVPPEPATEI